MAPTSDYTESCVLVSGTLSDVVTENKTYMVTQCNTGQTYRWQFYFDTGYTAAQLSVLHVEMKQNCSRTDTPGNLIYYLYEPGTTSWYTMHSGAPSSTTDQWVSLRHPTPSDLYDRRRPGASMVCACPTTGNSNNYNISYDVMKLILTVIPPVANFSGTPTVGAAPLAVSFTDSSSPAPPHGRGPLATRILHRSEPESHL